MKKITQNQKRSSLNEGRSYGIGFSILNKISDDKYETYLAFTACKDYLNDFIYVENTKKEIGLIHGYEHKLLNCFDNQDYFYLGVNTLNFKCGNEWKSKEEALNLLINNSQNLIKSINFIEELLHLENKTTFEIDEDTLILKVPIYWAKSTPLISAYTLFIRCFFNMEFDENKDFMTQIDSHTPFITDDKYLKNTIVDFVKKIKDYKYDEVDYEKFTKLEKSEIHNFGISSYLNKINKT